MKSAAGRRQHVRAAVQLAFGVAAWPMLAQEPAASLQPTAGRPVAVAVRVTQPPVLDGRVAGDPAWTAVAPLSEFWQTFPDAGYPATEHTEVRVVYTADAIYFGAVLHDSSPALTTSDARRDLPLDDTDSFRILLDTFHDRQNGFVFGTNPAGLEYDAQVNNEGSGFSLNWDGAWEVRTASFDGGWSAEFRIPFRTLRYQPGPGRTWGLNFQRTLRRRKEHTFWAPLPMQFDLQRVSQAGSLSGLDLPSQNSLKIIPFALGRSGRPGASGGRPVRQGDVGVDAKYMVTPGLTLDTTVNTDFAQVEVDDQQINLDRFNLFFPEKRPFFLENAGLFAVGSPDEAEVFFSRRIGIGEDGRAIPIIAGARLSGRVGAVSLGVVNMQTGSRDDVPAHNFTVARVRRDFRNRSNIGAMFVGREPTGGASSAPGSNRALALDGRWGLGQTGLVSGYAARTHTPGLTDAQHAVEVAVVNETRPLTMAASWTDIGRNFRPETGFLARPGGFRKLSSSVFARLRPDSPRFQEFRPHGSVDAYWAPDGFQQTAFWHFDNHIEFKNWWEIHTGVNLTREGVEDQFEIAPGVLVPQGTYDHAETQLVLQSNQGAPVFASVELVKGGFFGGRRLALNGQLRWRRGETLNVDLAWDRNDVALPWGSFVTNLARSRVSWSFTPRLFLQGLLQYNDRVDAWSTNVRFGWIQQANTGLFVVYSDARPTEGAGVSRGASLAGHTDRSLVVKFSRMFDVLH